MPKRKASVEFEVRTKIRVIKTEDSDSDSDDEVIRRTVTHQLSDYEKRRLENIRQNNELLAELNIGEIKKSPKEVLPLRQSLRIRRIAPDGSALPDLPPPPRVEEHLRVINWPVYKKQRSNLKLKPERISDYNNDHPRLPSGPLEFEPENDIEDADSKAFISKLSQLSCKVKATAKIKIESQPTSWHQKSLAKLQVKEDHVRKLVPQRIFCVRFHPMQSKTIVLASGKWGRLGIWDVGSKRGSDGVYLYQPHARPINCMAFDPADTSKLYTCSYDGTIRCADFDAPVFHDVFSMDPDGTVFSYLSHGTTSRNTVLASCGDGTVKVIDSRLDGKNRKAVHDYDLHDTPIKVIDVHPTDKNIFLTTTNKGKVAFWDARYIKSPKTPVSSMLSSINLNRSVSSAFFSPHSGSRVLATSMNNTVSVHEVSSGVASQNASCLFRHDNYTGRWLSTFHAVWDPKYESVFAIGSMKQPRQIDIYSSESKAGPILNLQDENLNSINSRLAFHPSRNMLAGGNSSGKVYLWTEK